MARQRSSWQVLKMNKNISWDLGGGGNNSLEEFWGDKRGGEEWREDKGAMNKYDLQFQLVSYCN